MTDPSTPVPSDEAIDAAHADLMRPRCRTVIVDRRNVPSALTAAYAIDAPRLRAEAAAEARAATLREVEAWLRSGPIEPGDSYAKWVTAAAAEIIAAHFNPEANEPQREEQ